MNYCPECNHWHSSQWMICEGCSRPNPRLRNQTEILMATPPLKPIPMEDNDDKNFLFFEKVKEGFVYEGRLVGFLPMEGWTAILRRPPDTELNRLRAKLAEEEQKVKALNTEKSELQKQFEEKTQELFELDLRLRNSEMFRENTKKFLEEQQARNLKLEEDIGKIREAVGELKMKEILSS